MMPLDGATCFSGYDIFGGWRWAERVSDQPCLAVFCFASAVVCIVMESAEGL